MADSVSILDGSTFCVSDRRGDIDTDVDLSHGFFFRDTRHLSRLRLTVAGKLPRLLSVDDSSYFAAQFFLAPETGAIYRNATLSLIRRRLVGDGIHEDLTVFNHAREPVEIELRLEVAADFADLFEVKDALAKKGELYTRVAQDVLVLGYRRGTFTRETRIGSDAPEATADGGGLSFALTLEAHSSWQTCLWIQPVASPRSVIGPKYEHGETGARPNMDRSLEEWLRDAPTLETDWDGLAHTYERSLIDLAALRFHPPMLPDVSVPAAGLPWFMALFGRDSLIASYQALPFVPELAETTLRVLASQQATEIDDFRDAEPGKILHEIRFGELTHFRERPHSPYYGSADATPLFLVLLDEVERWTGNTALVRDLEPAARAALAWIDEYGDRDGDGFIEYERRNEESGLENQCWKDSWNSIIFADGSASTLPRATCELQGYAYDAKRRCARLARAVWGDETLAGALEREAADLKRRFNETFWIPERQTFALALDGEKRKVDSLTSNIGHLLWSGIVDEEKAPILARELMGERLFSGWGVRTMAEGESGYNPIEYHNGTVWPHDNSLVAAGLARYGFRAEASAIYVAMIEAAGYFRFRLPEVFAGYPRSFTRFPVEYPTASSPQAWATGAPLLLLRTVLGLEPNGDELSCAPVLPEGAGSIRLSRIPGRWGRAGVSTSGHSGRSGL